MLENMNNCPYTLLLGRVLLAFIYFFGGIGLLSGNIPIEYAATKSIPEALVWVAFGVKMLGGFAIIVGYQTRIAAIALAIFTTLTAFIFHDLFGVIFLKEMSMIGGLLILSAVGPGKFSVDEKTSS